MLSGVWHGWLRVARKIAHVQSLLILGVAYFVIIAPFALAVRLFSDPLALRVPPSWRWLPRGPECQPSVDALRQQS